MIATVNAIANAIAAAFRRHGLPPAHPRLSSVSSVVEDQPGCDSDSAMSLQSASRLCYSSGVRLWFGVGRFSLRLGGRAMSLL